MNGFENFRMAFESLWSNRTRSILALLGIVIGVFAVTSMVSLGQMATAGISKDLESVAGRGIIVQPNFDAGMNLKRLSEDDIRLLARLPVQINPQVAVSAQYEKSRGVRKTSAIYGTMGDLPKHDPSIRMKEGRYFTENEANGGLAVAVINPAAARELLPNRRPLGQRLRVFFPGGGRIEVVVVGVQEPMPALFGGEQIQVIVPTPLLWRTHPDTQRGKYDFLMMRVQQGYQIDAIVTQVKQLLDHRYQPGVFRVDSAESFQSLLSNITTILQALLGAIGGLSLLVGGIGIMNIMLVSVTERTREIGLRKALGATSRQIKRQFLIEAVVLTVSGGLMGVVLAVLVLLLIAKTVPFLSVFVLSPVTVLAALLVSAGTGLFFGVWPAIRASRLDPIESLRYE